MNCEYSSQLHAFHDGQLPPDQHRQVEGHLAGCAICREELAQLRRLSRWMGGLVVPELSDMAVKRMAAVSQRSREMALVRVAGILSGIAAAILLVGVLELRFRQAPVSSPVEWERTALSLDAEPAGGAEMQVASWMDNELSDGGGNQP